MFDIPVATDDAPPEIIDVRRNPDGTLDEIVADGCSVHLEQMDRGVWWLAVERDGWRQVVWLSTKRGGAIVASSEADDWPDEAPPAAGP